MGRDTQDRLRQPVIALAIALALAALGGCSSGDGGGTPDGGITHTGGATGCPLADGCAGASAGISLLSFEITPPGGAAAKQFIPDVPFPAAGTTLELGLRQDARLCGSILKDFTKVTGTVFATPDPSPIAGMAQSYQGSVATGGGFCVTVPTGRYAIQCIPDNQNVDDPAKALPPLRRTVDVVEAAAQLDLEYPSDANMLRVDGAIMVDFTGIPDIAVRAYDKTTGIESNTALTSTPGGSDPGGAFHLNIPALTGTYNLVLSSTPQNPDWPTVEYPAAILGATTTPLQFDFGVVPAAVTVTGQVRNLPAGAVGAQVGFRAAMGAGIFTKTVQTDADGTFRTILREGTYDVTIVPPITAATAGITSFSGVAVASGSILDLTLTDKKALAGVVRYPDGADGDGVVVSARRLGSCARDQSDSSLPPAETSAGRDGSYALALDTGLYEITFVPPQGVQNARAIKRGLCIADDGVLNVNLPRTALVQGRLLRASGDPAADTAFNIWLNHADATGRAVLAGAGTTGVDGSFTVALPDLSGD